MAPLLHRAALPLMAAFLILLPGAPAPAAERKAPAKTRKARALPRAPVSDLITRIETEEARLETARRLCSLATGHEEKQLAMKAVRLADHQLDQAFLIALRRAADSPVPPTPEARELDETVKALESNVEEQQAVVDKLKKQTAKARGRRKESLEEQFELEEAKLELAKDELADAREDLINAGGDLKSQIERLQAEHKAAEQHSPGCSAGGTAAGAMQAAASSDTLLGHLKLWMDLHSLRTQLEDAQNDTRVAAEAAHQRLQSTEKEIGGGAAADSAPSAQPAQSPTQEPPKAAAEAADESGSLTLEMLHKQSRNQKILAGSKLRIRDLEELAATYGKWDALEAAKQKEARWNLLFSTLWIALIVLLGIAANRLLRRLFLRMTQERRRLHTLRAMSRFGVQAFCLALILLVVLGPPGQLATLVAFAGAGLTVALKDFIVSFIGWFMLMGRNGVHAGDWVEINGVCGEVIEVTLFHTVLLETGNWNDPGHPTGRKVTFTNSYAIEGHYFNFTTSGQWLWDELEFLSPSNEDPNVVADAVLRMVSAETQANAQLAEQEWSRLGGSSASAPGAQSVSAAPMLNVRPSGQGVVGRIRYITRANERFQTRTRLYHLIVELLHGRSPASAQKPSATPVAR